MSTQPTTCPSCACFAGQPCTCAVGCLRHSQSPTFCPDCGHVSAYHATDDGCHAVIDAFDICPCSTPGPWDWRAEARAAALADREAQR